MEFLTVAGLIILVITIAVVVTWQTGVLQPASCDRYKIAFSQVMPTDWAAYRDSNTLVLRVENKGGYTVNVTDANAAVGDVSCTATPSQVMKPGDSAFIILNCSGTPTLSSKYMAGGCYRADVGIRYLNIKTGDSHKSNGNIRGAVEEGAVAITTSTSTTSTSTTTTTSTTISGDSPPSVMLISPLDGSTI